MKVVSAEFVTSAAAGGTSVGIPKDGLLQVAVAGRSNVGKSTLINALCRRPMARTSAAAGKTRLANIFRVRVEGPGRSRWTFYLVDLPGYGYARGGATAGEELRAVAEAYFAGARGSGLGKLGRGSGLGISTKASRDVPECRVPSPDPSTSLRVAQSERSESRGEPRLVMLLVDSRHPGLAADIQAHEWLEALGAEPMIIATKVDKLSRAERTRNLREYERIFGKPALPVSAERGEGMDELWKTIANRARAARTRAAHE